MVNDKHFSPERLWLGVWVLLFITLSFLTREVVLARNFLVSADQWFEELLHSVRTPFLLDVFNGITFFGTELAIIGITGTAGVFLFFSKPHRAYAIGLAVTVIGATATTYLMKHLIMRARPDGLIPSVIETSFSFPSGHATAALALYGFLAYVLCKLFPEKTKVILIAAIVIIGSMGFSRLYLGVHFPSDVLAGYLLGGLWLLIGVGVIRKLNGRKSNELCDVHSERKHKDSSIPKGWTP